MNLRLLTEGDKDDLATPVKPWQRLACLLYVNGQSLRDIARELQHEQAEVTAFVTSARGRAILSNLIENNAKRLEDLLRATAVDSLLTLVLLRDTARESNVRARCAIELLNKIRSAAPPVKDVNATNTENDFTDVEAEIERLREQVEGKFK